MAWNKFRRNDFQHQQCKLWSELITSEYVLNYLIIIIRVPVITLHLIAFRAQCLFPFFFFEKKMMHYDTEPKRELVWPYEHIHVITKNVY